jgi:chorismate mutase
VRLPSLVWIILKISRVLQNRLNARKRIAKRVSKLKLAATIAHMNPSSRHAPEAPMIKVIASKLSPNELNDMNIPKDETEMITANIDEKQKIEDEKSENKKNSDQISDANNESTVMRPLREQPRGNGDDRELTVEATSLDENIVTMGHNLPKTSVNPHKKMGAEHHMPVTQKMKKTKRSLEVSRPSSPDTASHFNIVLDLPKNQLKNS